MSASVISVGAARPEKDKQIALEMDQIERHLGGLREAIDRLEGNLQPILIPVPDKEPKGETATISVSPMANDLNRFSSLVYGFYNRIQEINARLDI